MNNEEKKVEVDVKLKLSDVFRYNMYIAYKSPLSKITVIFGLLLLGWLINGAINRGDMGLDLFITYNIVWIIVTFLILVSRPWKIWTITAAQMQQPIFSKGSKYIFYTDKIYMEVGDLKDEIPWKTYIKIIETNKDFRFFVDEVQAQIIPKHSMNQQQIEQLKDLIKTCNSEEVYKLKR